MNSHLKVRRNHHLELYLVTRPEMRKQRFRRSAVKICSCWMSLLDCIRAWDRSRLLSGVLIPSPPCCCGSVGVRNVVAGGESLSCPHEHVLAQAAEQWSNTSSDGFEQNTAPAIYHSLNFFEDTSCTAKSQPGGLKVARIDFHSP